MLIAAHGATYAAIQRAINQADRDMQNRLPLHYRPGDGALTGYTEALQPHESAGHSLQHLIMADESPAVTRADQGIEKLGEPGRRRHRHSLAAAPFPAR